jgi:hypothetical protein
MFRRLRWTGPRILLLLVLPGLAGASEDTAAVAARYRTGVPDPRVQRIPAEIQQGVFTDPKQFLEPLVRRLTDGASDEFHKTKLLHDWIAENIAYDVRSYFSDTSDDNAAEPPEETLVQRQAVCHGYTSLFKQMCTLAGIPCEDISGYGRGYSYVSGRNANVGEENHAWNAVRIDERWFLVDVTWDAGYVGEQAFRKEYRTTYLFMEPRYFVFTHLPSESRWQLLRKPLTSEQFDKLPYLHGTFFDHDMRLLTRLARVTPAGGSVQFSIQVSAETEVMAKLTSPAGEKSPQRTLVQHDKDRCKVFALFPRAGPWSVRLFVRPRGSTDSYEMAAKLDFEASSGTKATFPETYNVFAAMRGYLHSPLYLPLDTESPVLFKVRLSGAHDVSLAIGDEPWLKLTADTTDTDVYQLRTTVPAGQRVRLNAKAAPDEESYDTVIAFSVPGKQ